MTATILTMMTIFRRSLMLASALVLAACSGSDDAAATTEQPGDTRIEAVRARADEADSLMRARMRDVEEASRQD